MNIVLARYCNLLLFWWFQSFLSSSIDCDFYIAPSRVFENGIGIFAGRKFNKFETTPPGVIIRIRKSYPNWPLQHFVYGPEVGEYKNVNILELGPASLYNHHEENNLKHDSVYIREYPSGHFENHVLPEAKSSQLFEANSVYPQLHYEVLSEILPGEEMFISYGPKSWFLEREVITFKTPTKNESAYKSMEFLQKNGYCVSNIHTNTSRIQSQESPGQGVFASVDFKKGELVDVSPVLILPKHEVKIESNQRSVLINFCFSRPGSDVALLPLGYGAVCNHGGKKKANVEINWHFWGQKFNESVLKMSPDMLLQADFAKMYFGYRALRNIKKGEELLIDYGRDWETDWEKYIQAKREHKRFEKPFPIFRRTMDLPSSIFPEAWYIDCIGGSSCDNENDIDLYSGYHYFQDEDIEKIDAYAVRISLTTTIKGHIISIYWLDALQELSLVAVLGTTDEPNEVITIEGFPGHNFTAKIDDFEIQNYTVNFLDEHHWFNISYSDLEIEEIINNKKVNSQLQQEESETIENEL